mgnify:CR=1 FL=1
MCPGTSRSRFRGVKGCLTGFNGCLAGCLTAFCFDCFILIYNIVLLFTGGYLLLLTYRRLTTGIEFVWIFMIFDAFSCLLMDLLVF